METIKKQIFDLLKENTGAHFLDSGGDNNRHWQKNKERDFNSEPEVVLEDDGYFTVSLYHYLTNVLEIDEVSKSINRHLRAKKYHWCGEVDEDELINFLDRKFNFYNDDIDFTELHNTYNWENSFSQDFQFIEFSVDGSKYILIQIHGGADIRGGYTDVKCFKIKDSADYFGYYLVCGDINSVGVENSYNGYSLTDENGNNVTYNIDNVLYNLNIYFNCY